MVGAPLACLRHLTESTKMSNHITESKERAKLFRSPSWMHNFQLLILYIKLYFLKAFCNFLVNQIHGCRSCSLWLLQYNLPNTTDSIWYTLFANKEKKMQIFTSSIARIIWIRLWHILDAAKQCHQAEIITKHMSLLPLY